MKEINDRFKESRNKDWRVALRKKLPAKERIKLERVNMPETKPEKRIKSQRVEVNLGLPEEKAIQEARRCMDCAKPTCVDGCPVRINIPEFIKNIERKEFLKAAKSLKIDSALPAVCGRVCPQEKQCEELCFFVTKLKKESVAIGHLERFAADYEYSSGKIIKQPISPPNNIKIAVVGSGPSGLSFAGDMTKYGYDVTVFEALHELGGVLRYGIPEFRLPNQILDNEIDSLQNMGVKFVTNFIVGRTQTFDELTKEGYKAFYIASGAGFPRFMNIPGENSNGVLSANEYLTRVNLMGADSKDSETPVFHGKNVIVVGGGNTAMDAVRTALRLGAETSTIVYRRSEAEMPARIEEIHHAKAEGVKFKNLANPIEFIINEKGFITQTIIQHMELGEPDESGRRRPIPIKGSTEIMDTDVAIIAVGTSPNPLISKVLSDIEITKWGTLVVNENLKSTIDNMYAGGDIVRGGATVILAMGDGRKAAKAMHEDFQNGKLK